MRIGPHVISYVGFSYSTKCAFLVFKLIALLGKYRFWFDFPFVLSTFRRVLLGKQVFLTQTIARDELIRVF